MLWWIGGKPDLYFNSFPFKWFFPVLLVPIIVWSLVWKGLALYRAARNEQKPWFIAILISNTLGILPIIYLFIFSKQTHHKTKKNKTKKNN